ncbi:MAG: dihydrolipoyl dehydrogenase [Propionibacteriaceae bacterium]|jgi:dihydrolipoamide dehydrogenase|nr:dihydrolipoyl dehydrogenase [Propionibacteriaceae bacterium]
MTVDFDVVVLGAGPGGYVAAIRAAQLGLKTAIVEERWWGGVCLNLGCIPTKALLRNAELAHTLTTQGQALGVTGQFSFDYGKAFSRSRAVSERMVKGVHFLMRKNRVTELSGRGEFVDAGSLIVSTPDGPAQTIRFQNCVIATGAQPKRLPQVEPGPKVVTYAEQIMAEELPASIIICGAGPIGVEFAYILASYGVEVTLVEYLDRVLPGEDREVSAELTKAYRRLGVKLMTGRAVESISQDQDLARVTVRPVAGGEAVELAAEKVLLSLGFAPRTEGYGLERTGVELTEGGAIAVDEMMRTSVAGLYAVGDVTGQLMLAHVAEAQAQVAVETLAGRPTFPVDYAMAPRATYCQPQVASFGLTEQRAHDLGHAVKVSKFPFAANGKAWALGEAAGFVKIVADVRHGEILGAHMVGPDVSELLPELTLARMWDLTAEEVGRNIHAHPSLSEAIKEAAEGVTGPMVNF